MAMSCAAYNASRRYYLSTKIGSTAKTVGSFFLREINPSGPTVFAVGSFFWEFRKKTSIDY